MTNEGVEQSETRKWLTKIGLSGAVDDAWKVFFHSMFLVSLTFGIYWVAPPYEIQCRSIDVCMTRFGFVVQNWPVGLVELKGWRKLLWKSIKSSLKVKACERKRERGCDFTDYDTAPLHSHQAGTHPHMPYQSSSKVKSSFGGMRSLIRCQAEGQDLKKCYLPAATTNHKYSLINVTWAW